MGRWTDTDTETWFYALIFVFAIFTSLYQSLYLFIIYIIQATTKKSNLDLLSSNFLLIKRRKAAETLNLKTTTTTIKKTESPSIMRSQSPRHSLYYSVMEGVTFQRVHVAGFCQSKQCEMESLNAKITC